MIEEINEIKEFLDHIDGRVGEIAHDEITNTVKRLESKIKALKNKETSLRIKENVYNAAEMRHIAVNFAITCQKGYDGSFDDWIKKISPLWRKIANK